MENRKTILVCGSIVYDRIMNFPGKFSDHILPDKVHILNVSFALNRLSESFGGTGGNIAYNLALLGERPKLMGAAGSDFEKYADWLKRNNVDISQVKIADNELTASAYIMTDQADNQIAGFYGGPKTPSFPPKADPPLAEISPLIRGRTIEAPLLTKEGNKGRLNALAIVSPDAVARMSGYVKIFRRIKLPYIFDPGQQITALSAKELKWATSGAKVLIGNDYEIELILNKIRIKKSDLIKLAKILIITKGEQGSEIYDQGGRLGGVGKKIIIPPAKPKAVLDPTGAGDAYRAGLIKGMAEGWNLEKCGRLASAVAAYTVEKYGTQTHKFSWQELEKRYRENFREKL